jgi:hypothetical protein
MKVMRILLLAFAAATAAFFSLAASAQSVIFTNNDGTFTFDDNPGDATYNELALGTISNGLGESGQLTAISGLSGFGIPNNAVTFPACQPTCLGSISLNTGTIASGSILTSATFNPGGNFTVHYTNGVIFSGSFVSASWNEIAANTWQFTGVIMNGTLTVNGNNYVINTAADIQLTTVGEPATYHSNKKTYTFQDSGGTTNFMSPAPEPGSLALFGSGLIVVGLITRRRLSSKGATTQG